MRGIQAARDVPAHTVGRTLVDWRRLTRKRGALWNGLACPVFHVVLAERFRSG